MFFDDFRNCLIIGQCCLIVGHISVFNVFNAFNYFCATILPKNKLTIIYIIVKYYYT